MILGAFHYPCALPLGRDPWLMFRAVMVRLFGVILWASGLALAQDPPPLEGPAPQPERPAATAPPSRPSSLLSNPSLPGTNAPARARPVLAIPGVTAPSQRSGPASRPKIPQPSRPSTSNIPAPGAGAPSLASPGALGSPFSSDRGTPVRSAPVEPSRDSIELTLEPLDPDPALDQKHPGSTSPRGTSVRAPVSTPAEERERASSGSRTAPWRMPGMLGRVLGQPPPRRPRDPSRSREAALEPGAKDRSEPETDAVVKRRIEQQVESTLGDRVQSVEVRVSGRNVLIVARATRFWQKRGIRRALESLPALTGFRARIDLDD